MLRSIATAWGRTASVASVWAVAAGMMADPASANPVTLVATQDPEVQSTFTLDFGTGTPETSEISNTQFTLHLDDVLGTAAFGSYYQQVAPLTLPGGYSTGNIEVTVAESLGGTYDAGAGVFTTSDVYSIAFDGDLSDFGITSPFELPGDATGQIEFETPESGRISMAWVGSSALPDPQNPGSFIPFSYTCAVHTEFVLPEPASLLLLVAAGALGLRRRRDPRG